jgi:hypothetical protein
MHACHMHVPTALSDMPFMRSTRSFLSRFMVQDQEQLARIIMAFNSSPALAERVGVGAGVIAAATAECIEQGHAAWLVGAICHEPPQSPQSLMKQPQPQLLLTFKHDCQHLGCSDAGCALCSQNQFRRCTKAFSTKYLSGDAIKAVCGAVIR